MQRYRGRKLLFRGPVLQFGIKVGFPQYTPSSSRRSEFKENGYILLRLFVALIALAAFAVSLALPVRIRAAAVAQDTKQEPKKDTRQEAKPADPKQNGKDVKFTAEQVVESVILIYGTRPALDQIRRNGIERVRTPRPISFPNTTTVSIRCCVTRSVARRSLSSVKTSKKDSTYSSLT